jgi:hypothetical protein
MIRGTTQAAVWTCVAALAATSCTTPHRRSAAPRPQTNAPPPTIAEFLPADYRVVKTMSADLDRAAEPEVVVTAVGSADASLAPSTVLVLAWDAIARRWTAVFDASKQPTYSSELMTGEAGPGLVPQSGNPPQVAVVHDQANNTNDLLYWLQAAAGNGIELKIGMVHFTNQIASLAWSFNNDEAHTPLSGQATVVVIGKAPNEQVKVTLPWITQVDSRSDAARLYSFVVAPDPTECCDQYRVVSDDRPLVGVGLVTGPNGTQGQVAYIAPHSAAASILREGDVIDGIHGMPPPADAVGLTGPIVIEEIAQHHPGDEVTLDIERDGERRAVTLKLGQWNLPIGQSSYSTTTSEDLYTM